MKKFKRFIKRLSDKEQAFKKNYPLLYKLINVLLVLFNYTLSIACLFYLLFADSYATYNKFAFAVLLFNIFSLWVPCFYDESEIKDGDK